VFWLRGPVSWNRSFQNAWLTVEADMGYIRLPPEERFGAAMDLLGVDLTRLSDDVGHA
jgi:putative transcriptional regulator